MFDYIREAIVILLLAICMYTDIKEKYVYILPMIVAVISALSVTVMDIITSPVVDESSLILQWIIWPFIIGATGICITRALNNVVGIGDAYLFATVGLLIGVKRNLIIFCVAVLICGVVSAGMLCARIKSRKDYIAFVPYYFTAYLGILITSLTI